MSFLHRSTDSTCHTANDAVETTEDCILKPLSGDQQKEQRIPFNKG